VKELREFVRDKRTLLLALVLGPLITPAIMLGILTLAEIAREEPDREAARRADGRRRTRAQPGAWLAGQGIDARRSRRSRHRDPHQAEDVYLRIGDDFAKDWHEGAPALVEIVHDSTRQDSDIPVKRIEAALHLYGQQVGALRLLARGMNPVSPRRSRCRTRICRRPKRGAAW
jgi:sodium transport system permease protein